MVVPEAAVRLFLRAAHANRTFTSVEGARGTVRARALRPRSCAPPTTLPAQVRLDVEHDGHNAVYTVAPRDGAGGAHVVYSHGGGWVNEIRREHWTFLAQIAAEAGVTVTVPVYDLLPHGTAQAAHDLVVRTAERLLGRDRRVCLAGDSAGGQISLSVAQTLRDRGVQDLRTVLVSPALDLTFDNPRIPLVQPDDPWLGRPGGRELGRLWAGDLAVTDPRVSPLFGELRGLGPVLLFTGTHDVLNPDAHVLADRARAAGVPVDLLELAGGLHVFPLLPTASGRRARAHLAAALRGWAGR